MPKIFQSKETSIMCAAAINSDTFVLYLTRYIFVNNSLSMLYTSSGADILMDAKPRI
jgi:hypothetical protein